MSRERRETVRGDVSAQAGRASDWPDGFDPGNLRRWRTSHHVLTLRCSACHRPRALLLAPADAVTLEAILGRATWHPAGGVVRNPCACLWVAMPGAPAFRGAIARAVRAELGRVDEHTALVVVASPPNPEGFHHGPGGAWVPRSEPGDACLICDTPTGHRVTAD